MWIMIAGPYRHGTNDPEIWEGNLRKFNDAAFKIFKKGHIPIIGVNLALPIIEAAGHDTYGELMMPISLALAEKCNAVLRIDGVSTGADQEVEIFKNKGLPVYYDLDEVPDEN